MGSGSETPHSPPQPLNSVNGEELINVAEFVSGVRSKLSEYRDMMLSTDLEVLGEWVSCLRPDFSTDLRLRCGEVAVPLDMNNLSVSVELLMYRTGLASKLRNVAPAVFALTRILNAVIKESTKLNDLRKYVETERRPSVYRVASDIADYIISKYKVIAPVINDSVLGLYCFDGGAYRECESLVMNEFERAATALNLKQYMNRFSAIKTDFQQLIEARAMVFKGFNHHLLLFKNKVVDWRKLVYEDRPVITDPSPDLMIYHRIPWEIDTATLGARVILPYDELLKAAEDDLSEIVSVFKDWVDERWPLLLEIIGYTLLAGEYPLNKAVMLVGEGKNGKSTYLGLIERLLGKENCVSVKLQDLVSDEKRFSVFVLYGKMANIFSDLPKEALRSTGMFKILTGEDAVTADRKFRDPITFTNYAKMLYSANELPRVTDMTTAFWRRWIVIKFEKQFPPNTEFRNNLYNNIIPRNAPKLLAYALLAARHVVRRGKFSFEETEADYKNLWLRETDPVYDFLKFMEERGYVVRDENGRVDDKELYELYTKYHGKYRDDEVLAKKTFTERLESHGITKKIVMGRKYYAGISLTKPPRQIKNEIEQDAEETP